MSFDADPRLVKEKPRVSEKLAEAENERLPENVLLEVNLRVEAILFDRLIRLVITKSGVCDHFCVELSHFVDENSLELENIELEENEPDRLNASLLLKRGDTDMRLVRTRIEDRVIRSDLENIGVEVGSKTSDRL
jgi:hypothetical protein